MYRYETETVNAVSSNLMNGPLPWLIGGMIFFVILTAFLLRKAGTMARDIAEGKASLSQSLSGPKDTWEQDLRNVLLPDGEIRFDLYVAKDSAERAEVIEHARTRLLNHGSATYSQLISKRHPLARDVFTIQEEAFKAVVYKVIPKEEESPVELYWELERAFEEHLGGMSYQAAEKDLAAVYVQVKEQRAAERAAEEAEVTEFWNGLTLARQLSLINAETRSQQKAAISRFGGNPDRLDVMARLGFVEEAPILAPRKPADAYAGGGEGGYAYSDGGDGGGGGGGD